MPRVANPPAANGRKVSGQQLAPATPHKQSPMKIPLNDDRGEKAARLQSRQALHDLQMNAVKAAASPMRKLNKYDRAASSSPKMPRSNANRGGKENDHDGGGGLSVVGGSAVTPMKRVPILANFEEWMKLATDNKINATNSWNFALIDYFHDMSLLKEGDGVNFQKASCTLDGCVKIYTSRVDSVATETGKLLSGLADSGGKKRRENEEEGEDGKDDEGEDGEDGVKKKTRKKGTRSAEATLAPSFASLQLKKFELEFGVDPLFKKASADFDEGGAKGLLLNHLAIDSHGRIVFDSSDDAGEATAEGESRRRRSDCLEEAEESEEGARTPVPELEVDNASEEDTEIDVASLASKFFPDLSRLEDQDICPSLKTFDLGDPAGSLDIPFLKAPEDWRQDKPQSDPNRCIGDKSGIMLDDDNAAGFDDDMDDGILGGFDLPPDTGFGEGGEAWAKDAALEPMLKVHRVDDADLDADNEGIAVGDFDPSDPNGANQYAVSLTHQPSSNSDHENILSYFDSALHKQQRSWAGPEHWRIRRIKDLSSNSTTQAPKPRKEKEPFEINFLNPLDQSLADMIYTPASSNAAITLPKTQWKTKGRNLLPDDKHFSSRDLLRLFLKPKARIGARRSAPGRPAQNNQPEIDSGNAEIDEAYWASQKPPTAEYGDDAAPREGDYDANFFADDDGLAFPGGVPLDNDDDENIPFTDAREAFSPPADPNAPPLDSNGQSQSIAGVLNGSTQGLLPGGFGSQLVTQGGRRLRPEYVNYARVAKKVDVRRLKEEMWKGMSDSLISAISPAEQQVPNAPPTPAPSSHDGEMDIDEPDKAAAKGQHLKFTDMINGLKKVYPEQQMRDISTSYCFICLLHLANEKGLVLSSDGDGVLGRGEVDDVQERLDEIWVRKDPGVGEGYEGE